MLSIDLLIQRLHLPPTRERIVRNLAWSVLGKVVTLMGSLFVGILVARYLGPEQYGLMNYVVSFVFLFQVLSAFGLNSIEVREEAKAASTPVAVIGSAFGLRVVLAVLTIALCIGTAYAFEADASTFILVSVYSVAILANTFVVVRNYFMAIVQNEYVVKSEIWRTLVGIVVKVLLVAAHAPLLLFVCALVLDAVLLSSGYIIAYHRHVGRMRDWRFSRRIALHLMHEGFPLLLTGGAVILYQRIDQLMIGNLVDKTSLGYFSTASRFVEVLIFVPMMLSQTITPVLVGIRKHDEAAYRERSQLFMNVTIWASLAIAVLVSLCAYPLVRYTFGTPYLPAVAVLQVLAFKAPSVALSTTAGSMLVVEGLQKWAVCRDMLGCIVCIGLNWLLLPRYGMMAAAVVAIASNVVAGYVADALVPPYRHLFVQQTRALFCGWRDMLHLRRLLTAT